MQIIRYASQKDVALLLKMDEEIFPDAWTEAMWQSELGRQDATCLILEIDGVAVGFAVTTVLFEDAELPKIAVLQEQRGLGLGKTLLNALEKEAKMRGATAMFLEVRVGNISARKLYETGGYEKLRVRLKYYPDGEDALEMKKTL